MYYMVEERSKELPGEKKKDKPVVKKVMGRTNVAPDAEARKPGPPSYQHG